MRAGVLAALLLLAACGPGDAPADGPDAGAPSAATDVERASDRWPDGLEFSGANLVLISIDTLRADRLGAYGYDRGTTPNLDAFASEAVLFEDVYSNSCKTASSHMSMLTSQLPTVHKVRNQSARLGLESPVLADNRLSIAQVLTRNGYWNAAFCGGANLNPAMGFAKGFQRRFESAPVDISDMAQRARQRLAEIRGSGSPGFLFLHTYQVHGPYLPPRPFLERFVRGTNPTLTPRVEALIDLPFRKQWSAMNPRDDQPGAVAFWDGKESFGPAEAAYLSDLYDGEIAYADDVLGKLFEHMRREGFFEDTIVVLLADHGEEFFEHGDFEHDQLYREHLHVPLLVRLPGGRLGGTRVSGQAALIDVMPTLLELLAVGGPETFDAAPMQGESLVPAMTSHRTRNLPVFSERVMFLPDGEYDATLRAPDSAVTFHSRPSGGTLTAFDLRQDPGEHDDLACQPGGTFFPAARERLKTKIAEAMARRDALDSIDAGGTTQLDSLEQVENLTALGYVSKDGAEGTEPLGEDLLAGWPDDC
ncbi:MAG: sulfatase [Planctomycetes bacterium]|nr:sulfatase [Planctomycetota bacterium]